MAKAKEHEKIFKFGERDKVALKCEEKDGKCFDYYCNTIKRDAYSMASKFIASTLYYPATKTEKQIYHVQLVADLYSGKELLDSLQMSNEFKSRGKAEKWIFKVFREMFLEILEQA